MPHVGRTVNLDHIRFHYYHSHRHINPTGIVPRGPDVLRSLERFGS
jgi:putative glutathione S-transferase